VCRDDHVVLLHYQIDHCGIRQVQSKRAPMLAIIE